MSIRSRHRGPHALRHACATHLMAQGLSLKEIGDYLGHRSSSATRLYAKVDLAGLREVAKFDQGGYTPKQIAVDIQWASGPVWSPDGRRLLVLAASKMNDLTSLDFWLVSPDGGASAKTGLVSLLRSQQVFPPVGGLYVFSFDWIGDTLVFGNGPSIWTIEFKHGSPQPSELRKIASGTTAMVDVRGFASKLVFESRTAACHLWSLPLDLNSGKVLGPLQPLRHAGGSQTLPASSSDGRWLAYLQPAFSPDGSKILFRSERNGGGIYGISALGGEERLIAPRGRRPQFSPDGTQIAYYQAVLKISGHGRARGVIYLTFSNGGTPRELSPRFRVARSPVWSPDGKHLLFLGFRDEQSKSKGGQWLADQTDWWIVSLDGKLTVRTGALELLGRHGLALDEGEPGEWVATADGDAILFSATIGETTNIWEVAISNKTWQVTGSPRRLTSGTATETYPLLSARGLVFAGLSSNSDIWSLPIDAQRGKPLGSLQPLVQGGAEDIHSSLSRDGRTLAFNSGRSGYPDIWVKDLATGKESAVTEGPENETRVLISPDGSKVAYMVQKDGLVNFHLAGLGQGTSERLCENCGGNMLDWSPTGNELLYWWGNPIRFSLLDISSHRSQIVLQHPEYDLHRGQISPDGSWLAFGVPKDPDNFLVFVAPLRQGLPPKETEWISVASDAGCPHWSPDGNLLYFLSARDGFLCLWAQNLDPLAKRPSGLPFDVYHFHNARQSLNSAWFGTIGMSVARSQLVFSMKEMTGNIWMKEMER